MTYEFSGKNVLVTGAAGVMGTWISDAFARSGARLLLTDARAEPLEALADRLRGEGAQVDTTVADLSQSTGVEQLVKFSAQLWPSPHVLVNNAGIFPRATLMGLDRSDFEYMMAINVTAPFELTRGIAAQMQASKVAGSVINLTSGAASNTRVGLGHYSTSKAALTMLTRAFALELAPSGIRVNAVQPGFAPGSEVSAIPDSHRQLMVSTIPLGRTSGPDDAPQAILFLSSEHASFITGTTLTVDGGRTAGAFVADAPETEPATS